MSSGAAMAVACEEARHMSSGTVVAILPDGGERYLSTPLFSVRRKVGIRFFNTISRRKEPFEPLVPGKVSLYSCGPTAHARVDIGACRRFVFADLLCRYLEFRGYDVCHVMNITDLDDNTIVGSEAAGESLQAFTDRHIAAFTEDLKTLGIRPADHYPRASEHVTDMVDLARQLVNKGHAYEKLRSLYFNISGDEAYGRLSRVNLDKIRVGASVDLDDYEKDNPRDFTLLKRSRLSELKRGIYAKTEWGNVRPSWHLQCAAMSMKYLGESFDIHTSGRELMFPHHENEIAIARALTGKLLARFWLHCDPVLYNGKEIASAAEGLPLTVAALQAEGFSGREIRFWLLSSHYRRPCDFSLERLQNVRRALQRLDSSVYGLQTADGGQPHAEIDQLCYDLKSGFSNAMDDDLNISAAMASVFKVVKRINALIAQRALTGDDGKRIVDTLRNLDGVLGVFTFYDALHEPEIRRLLAERRMARQSADWTAADALRDRLHALGIPVHDRPLEAGEL
jgi:cysteinyl-tRNA synthetase